MISFVITEPAISCTILKVALTVEPLLKCECFAYEMLIPSKI